MPLEIPPNIVIPDWEFWFTSSRSGGPGGQHVNTTNSRITLHWIPANSSVFSDEQKSRIIARLGRRVGKDGALQIDVEEHRSQLRNRELAFERLQALLVEALKTNKARKATKPTRGSVERRLKEKRAISERKSNRKGGYDD